MVRLTILGAVDLHDAGGLYLDAVLAQPKRLALLSYLALARPRGFHRREVLLSIFWPQSDRATGRNSLRQALHFLRHALGDGAIISRGENDVGIDHEQLWCDAAAFETAVDVGDANAAMELYRGDLMPGTLLADAPEFNRWLDDEREHLRLRAEVMLESKATEAEKRGDHNAAVQARRRGSALEPMSARAALALMHTLVNAGNRAAAIQHAVVFTRALRDELGVDGDDEVTTFAAQLRGDSSTVAVDRGHTVSFPALTNPLDVKHGIALSAVVLPFAVHGDAAYHYLEHGMVDLLSRSLDGGNLRVIDPYAVIGLTSRSTSGAADPEFGQQVAQRFGAEVFVLGSVVGTHGRLQVYATLYHVTQGRLVTAEASVSDERALFEIVEDVTRQLLIGRVSPAQRLTRIAATLTRSITALKAYLVGESHYRRGRFGPAREALERAVDEDDSFALAWYRLGHVVFWLHQGELAIQHTRRAVGLSGRLRPHDRALIDAFLASLEGRQWDAERSYREVLSAQPDSVEAWLGLAQVLLHFNPFRGRPATDAEPPLARVLELDPENGPARMFTAYVMAKSGRYEEHVSSVRHWDDKTEFAIYPRAMHALLKGTRVEADAVIEELRQTSDATLNEAIRYVARLTCNLPGAQRIARLLMDPSRSRGANAHGHILSAQLAAASGQFDVAVKELAAATRFDPAEALVHRGLLATLPFLSVSQSEIAELRKALETTDASDTEVTIAGPFTAMHDGLHEARRLYVLGHLQARANAVEPASATADRLANMEVHPAVSRFTEDWSRGVRAHVAMLDGRPDHALMLLEGAHLELSWAERLSPSPFLSQNFERYLRAQLLETVGRDEDALGWYECVTGDFVHEVVFLAPSYLQRAKIHDRRGDYAKACEFYQRFIVLWRDAEPNEAAIVADAQRRLVRIGGRVVRASEQLV